MLLLALALPASADTLTFQAGSGSHGTTEDATLVGSSASNEDNFSDGEFLFADTSDGDHSGAEVRAVLRFVDVIGSEDGQIPRGSEIHSATVTFTVDNPGGTLGLHEILEDWQVDEVSWALRSAELGEWSAPGVDHPAASLKALSEVESPEGEIEFSVRVAVREWAQYPSRNLGFVLVPQSDNGADLHSSESPTIEARPKLTVEFTPGEWDTGSPEDTADPDGVNGVDEDDSGTPSSGTDFSSDTSAGGKDGCGCAAAGSGAGMLGLWAVGLVGLRRRIP